MEFLKVGYTGWFDPLKSFQECHCPLQASKAPLVVMSQGKMPWTRHVGRLLGLKHFRTLETFLKKLKHLNIVRILDSHHDLEFWHVESEEKDIYIYIYIYIYI